MSCRGRVACYNLIYMIANIYHANCETLREAERVYGEHLVSNESKKFNKSFKIQGSQHNISCISVLIYARIM